MNQNNISDFDEPEPRNPVHDKDRDMKRFIGEGAKEYLEVFRKFRNGRPRHFLFTWHWPAMFAPFMWSLYRKMWVWSVIIFLSGIIFWPFSNLLWASTANYLYYRHAQRVIKRIKKSDLFDDEKDQRIADRGEVSNEALMLAILIVLLLFVGAYWKLKLTPVFTLLSDNLRSL